MKGAALAIVFSALAAGCLPLREPAFFEAGVVEPEPPPAPEETRSVEVTHEEAPAEDAPIVVERRAPRRSKDLTFFRLGAGFGVLGRVDLDECRDLGLPHGYLHMRVTFHGDGSVVRAAVESPVAPPEDALNCIGERLRYASVPWFDGGDFTVSRSFFVN